LIAAAFEQDGYDEVILTPRSGDFGRDVVASKKGVGCVRIIDSVKALAPDRLVGQDDVRALLGVLSGDLRASKAILTTTSDFAPGIATDPYISPFMPTRLELMNGAALQAWLAKLSKI
jgi:restriction system protein